MDNRPQEQVCHKHCISWSAVLFGALVAVGLGFIFNILSLSLGLTAFPVTSEGKTMYAAWGMVGLSVISILSMFIAGWSAGYLGRSHCCTSVRGEFYGFGAWCLALVIAILLASQVGQFLNQRLYAVDRTNSTFQVVNQITQELKKETALSKHPSTPAQVEDAAKTLGMTTFATFFLVFIGALSAAFGGRVGMSCKTSECCPPRRL